MGRLNERIIRDELRKQAMSVPIPTDMWANISRQLDADQTPAAATPIVGVPTAPARTVAARRRSPMRHVLAASAVAGICWAVLIPLRGYIEPVQPAEVSAPAPASTLPITRTETPVDVEEIKRPRNTPPAVRTSVTPHPFAEGNTIY